MDGICENIRWQCKEHLKKGPSWYKGHCERWGYVRDFCPELCNSECDDNGVVPTTTTTTTTTTIVPGTKYFCNKFTQVKMRIIKFGLGFDIRGLFIEKDHWYLSGCT